MLEAKRLVDLSHEAESHFSPLVILSYNPAHACMGGIKEFLNKNNNFSLSTFIIPISKPPAGWRCRLPVTLCCLSCRHLSASPSWFSIDHNTCRIMRPKAFFRRLTASVWDSPSRGCPLMLTIRSPTWKDKSGRKSLSLGKIKFEKNA